MALTIFSHMEKRVLPTLVGIGLIALGGYLTYHAISLGYRYCVMLAECHLLETGDAIVQFLAVPSWWIAIPSLPRGQLKKLLHIICTVAPWLFIVASYGAFHFGLITKEMMMIDGYWFAADLYYHYHINPNQERICSYIDSWFN